MVGSAMLLLLYPRKAEAPSSATTIFLPRELSAFLLLAIVANIKFQGFFMAFILLASWAYLRWRDNSLPWTGAMMTLDRTKSLTQGLIAFLLCLCIAYQPIHNTVNSGNPFFPIQVAGLRGSVPKTHSPIQYLPGIPLIYNFASFFVSSTEIDPIIRSEAGWNFQRSWHNFNRPKPYYLDRNANHSWVMTGGSNGIIFVLLAMGSWLTLFPGRKELLSFADLAIHELQRRLIGVSFLFTFLPQTMELRYYMVILFMVALVATSSPLPTVKILMRWILVAGLWFIVATAFLFPTYFWLRTGNSDTDRGLVSPDPFAALKPRMDCAVVIRHAESGNRAILMGPMTTLDRTSR